MRRLPPVLGLDEAKELSAAARENQDTVVVPRCRLLHGRVARVLYEQDESEDWPLHVDLNQIVELSPLAAKIVLRSTGFSDYHRRPLRLNGLRRLSPETAKVLGHYKGGNLELNGLRHLTAKAAKRLGRLRSGRLVLGGIRRLTPDCLGELLLTREGVSLDGIDTLGPEFAMLLRAQEARYFDEYWELSLDGISHMPRTVARSLVTIARRARHNHLTRVSLGGVVALESPTLAKQIISRRSAVSITSYPVRSLTPEVGAVLARGQEVRLPKVSSLSVKCASSLAACQGVLDLGLDAVSAPVAKALAAMSGSALKLDHVQSIDPDVAETLAQADVRTLSFAGLATLGASEAAALSRAKASQLVLSSLVHLSDEAIRALSAFPGRIDVTAFVNYAADWDYFRGASAMLIAKHTKPLAFRKIRAVTTEEARALAAHGGQYMLLDGVTSLTQDQAIELCRYTGKLSLCGLEQIEDNVASALAGFGGWALVLRGLKRFSLHQSTLFAEIPKIKLP